jgi:hypothetical protein
MRQTLNVLEGQGLMGPSIELQVLVYWKSVADCLQSVGSAAGQVML